MKKLFAIALLFSWFSGNAQVNLDSLWSVWNDETQPDTTRLQAMKIISWNGYLFTKPDSAFHFAQLQYDFAKLKEQKKYMAEALNTQGASMYYMSNYTMALDCYSRSLEIRKQIGDKKGVASSLNNIGNIYHDQDDYDMSIEYHSQSLKIKKEINDKHGVGVSLNNIGNVYMLQGNYAKAIEFHTNGLKIAEEINDKNVIASALNNIGLIYREQNDYDKAIDYHIRSLKLKEEIGNKYSIANSLNNVGVVYQRQKNYEKATNYYTRSLGLRKEINDKKGIATTLKNIGAIYHEQGNYDEALDHYTRSFEIEKKIGDKNGIALSLNQIGIAYQEQGAHFKAIDYNNRSITISKTIGSLFITRDAAGSLYKSYKAKKNHKLALEMYELYIESKDSLERTENQQEIIRQEYQYTYEKKATADSVKAAEIGKVKDALLTAEVAENRRQRQQAYFLYGGLIVTFLFGVFIFNRFKVTKKQKEIIEEQKEKVDEAYEEINIINESLERTIRERTKKIQLQNDKLRDYAFSNSHKVRAPLARLMGLINLLKFKEIGESEQKEINNKIVDSAKELDEIIKHVSASLSEIED